MLQIVKKMRQILILALCSAMSLVAASSAMASTVTIANSLSGLTYYDGEYCGKIGATLDGSTAISGGMACVDISKHSYLGYTIGVNISTLQPTDMTNARFGSDSATIIKYEEAAWLLGQIPSHAAQTGEIQFAIWRLFDPGYTFLANADRTAVTIALEDSWMGQAQAALIIPQNYDFSSVRIYTPTADYASNQEFMSGAAISRTTTGSNTPIPASFLLLGSGLLGLGLLSRRKKAALVRGDQK